MDTEIIEWIEEQNRKGDEWVMVAGIPLHAVRRNLPNNRVGIGLRTLEGTGYALIDLPGNQIDNKKLTLVHDVFFKKKVYHVYTVPEGLAKTLQGTPLKGPTGYPAVLATGSKLHTLKRDDRYDGEAASPVVPKTRITLDIPEDLAAEVRAQAERSGRSVQEEFVFEISTGIKRQKTVQKHRASNKAEETS